MTELNGVHSVYMLRPNNFGFNNDTKNSNPWQNKVEFDQKYIAEKAIVEFDDMVDALTIQDIEVCVLKDSTSRILPDAVFINNWLTVTPDNSLHLFPLAYQSRRGERSPRLINNLKGQLGITFVNDLSHFEDQKMYLESTGSIVFDHSAKVAFASVSERTNERLFNEFCAQINYKGFVFNSFDLNGLPIYHTNVLLSITENFAVVCLDCIDSNLEKAFLVKMLEKSGKEIVEISIHQMLSFSGNCMEVFSKNGQSKLIMSRTGFSALKQNQIDIIEQYSELIVVNVSIIERVGGGSVRCMMMGVPSYLNG